MTLEDGLTVLFSAVLRYPQYVTRRGGTTPLFRKKGNSP